MQGAILLSPRLAVLLMWCGARSLSKLYFLQLLLLVINVYY